MSRAHWIPVLLAQARDGWIGAGGIEFPSEDERACWMPRKKGKCRIKRTKKQNALFAPGRRIPPDPAVTSPTPVPHTRPSAAEVEARRVRLLEQAAKMAEPGQPLSSRKAGKAIGLTAYESQNDRLALIAQGRWPYRTTQKRYETDT